jgi:hypothetical protein
LNCGSCPTGSTCGGGGVANQCGPCSAFSDDFTGTSLGPNWSVARGAFSESGGAARGTAPHSYAVWIGTPDSNAPVSVTLGPSVSPTYAGVIARANSSVPDRDHYVGYVGPDGRSAVASRNNYVYTYLGFGPQVGPGTHTLTLTATGTSPVTLSLEVDGATVITAVDSSAQAHASGSAGIFDFNGASRPLEHFTVGGTSCGCTPTTCAAHNATCGTIPDGCGGTLSCGTCPTGSTCGGGGVPNQCGSPANAFVDDFTGTSLGSNWIIARGAFSVSGGAAFGTAPHSYAVWIGTPDANAPVGVTLGPSVSPTYAGVIVRADSSVPDRDHYVGYVGPDNKVALASRNDYVYSYLGFGPQVGPGVHTITLTATGSNPVTLTVQLDGTTVITATDSSAQAHASGRAGIFDFNGASRPLEHFTVGP